MCARREANDEDTGGMIAEAGNRPAPVLPILIGLALGLRDFFTPSHETGTFATGDNFLIQRFKIYTPILHLLKFAKFLLNYI